MPLRPLRRPPLRPSASSACAPRPRPPPSSLSRPERPLQTKTPAWRVFRTDAMKHRPAGGIPADRIGPLYDQFAGALYRYALMILADPAGAADAVHHVFLALLTGVGAAMDDEERYLRRAVRNACFSAL